MICIDCQSKLADIPKGTPVYLGRCRACGAYPIHCLREPDLDPPDPMAAIDLAQLAYRCAMCGGDDRVAKHQVLVSNLENQDTPVDMFQRHLCAGCAPKAADFLMGCMDARERTI